MSTIWAFNSIKKKHTVFLGEDCVKELQIFIRKCRKYKNAIVNIRRTKITLKCKSMLHLWEKNLTKAH